MSLFGCQAVVLLPSPVPRDQFQLNTAREMERTGGGGEGGDSERGFSQKETHMYISTIGVGTRG